MFVIIKYNEYFKFFSIYVHSIGIFILFERVTRAAWIIPLLGGVRGGFLSPFPAFARTCFTRTRVVKSHRVSHELPSYPPLNPLPRGDFLTYRQQRQICIYPANRVGEFIGVVSEHVLLFPEEDTLSV